MTVSRSVAMQWLALTAAALALLYLLAPILAPFVAAAILAYVFDPLVDRLCAWKLPRTLGVLVVMLGALLLGVVLLLIMLPLLQQEMTQLAQRLPQWLDAARLHLLPTLQQWFGIELEWDSAALKQLLIDHWQRAGGLASGVLLPWLGDSGSALLALFANLLLMPVVMFYLLRDWDELLARVDALLPRQWHARIRQVAGESDKVLAEFLRGQIAVMLLMSVFYVVVLWLAGLEFALPIGIVAGMLVFVPYLGMLLGLLLATLAALMQYGLTGDLLWVWAVFGAGQLLEGMVITPWLVGERIGLHPLAVIFALLAFGQLFGFFGLLLALPMAAVLLVLLRHLRKQYLSSTMYLKP
ncbi:MAG: AI-2E family transporter [Sideroxydans sp.]|nr:AI-2E family transporter [Sideroxydans sp.]